MKDPLQQKLAEILKRDFEQKTGRTVTQIWWPNDDDYVVVVADGQAYLHLISDDDGWSFDHEDGYVEFPFSEEFERASEQGITE